MGEDFIGEVGEGGIRIDGLFLGGFRSLDGGGGVAELRSLLGSGEAVVVERVGDEYGFALL